MNKHTEHLDTNAPFLVGIAASAGGLEAASALVQNLPDTANAVYIVAQHMSPTYKSLLSSLLGRETKLPVVEAHDGLVPTPDTIYVTPPNFDVVIEGGKLRLLEPAGHPATPKPSADRLFKSIAEEIGSRCVAIVLSGTGSDGSYGVQAVREAGGITIAQDPTTAKYDGMPSSSIETGCIDLALTPEQIGTHLKKILARSADLEALQHGGHARTRLTDLLQILLARTQVDFRDYKENTINRRIGRRMVALGLDDYEEYVEYCRHSEEEVDALYRDLLISVTRFFRDPLQFEQFGNVIERLVASNEHGQIRVWIIGCATGEEAYSIAALFAEALGGLEAANAKRVQIFASDIDEQAIEFARKGVYPIAASNDVPLTYLDKYFELDGSNMRVVPEVRNMVLFSRHNVAQDPPFKHVDLVSLRNVLIYFNPVLQERVLNRVHYALTPTGTLFLGTSESIGATHAYFEAQDGADKVFLKRNIRNSGQADAVTRGNMALRRFETSKLGSENKQAEDQQFEVLARAIAPNGFIVTSGLDIIRVFGDISRAIQVSERSTLDMTTKILRPGLRDEASSLVSVVLKTDEMRTGRWHELDESQKEQCRIQAYPIRSTTGGEDHVLFAFQTRESKDHPVKFDELSEKDRSDYLRRIELEMITTREALEQTVEELQTTNEELQSVNEELQSANEELQATNEELETSNEELESTNEELITVNEEMLVKAGDLELVSTELAAILQHVPYPVLVVDPALIVRRMSDPASVFFQIESLPLTGRHIRHISVPEGFPPLPELCSEVFRLREERSLTTDSGGDQFTLTVRPFLDANDMLLGLNLIVVPISK